jgi:hypothetical protein
MKRFHVGYEDFKKIPLRIRTELFFDEFKVLQKEQEELNG